MDRGVPNLQPRVLAYCPSEEVSRGLLLGMAQMPASVDVTSLMVQKGLSSDGADGEEDKKIWGVSRG